MVERFYIVKKKCAISVTSIVTIKNMILIATKLNLLLRSDERKGRREEGKQTCMRVIERKENKEKQKCTTAITVY